MVERKVAAASLLTLLIAAVASCGLEAKRPRDQPGTPEMIRSEWSKAKSCPIDEIVVSARPDLRVHRFVCATVPPDCSGLMYFSPEREECEPRVEAWKKRDFALAAVGASSLSTIHERCGAHAPPEVSADSERLALWRKRQDERWDDVDRRFTIPFEISGCGETGYFACGRWATRKKLESLCSKPYDLGKDDPGLDR
jgi:hypothetical protein